MTDGVSRRTLLHATGALGAGLAALAALPRAGRAAEALTLRAERRTLEVKGRAARVFGLTRPDGAAGVFLDPGQRFLVNLANALDEPTIVHWHGQTPPVAQDGVAMTGFEQVIAARATQPYDFAPRPGTHWMHSHQGLQEMQLLAGPLIVRTAADLRLDAQEVVVMLHDFSFRSPAELMADLGSMSGMKMGGMAGMKMGDAKMGGMQMGGAAKMPGMDMPGMPSGGGQMDMSMPGMKMGDAGAAGMKMGDTKMGGMDMSGGQAGGGMSGMKMGAAEEKPDGETAAGTEDLNDIDFDAYLANDRTLDDPQVVRTERGGRVRLRLINASSATAYWIDLGSLVGTVIAADGEPVVPVQGRVFPLAEAQRLDILVDVPAGRACPILAQRVGDTARTGIILAAPDAHVARVEDKAAEPVGGLTSAFEMRLAAATPLAARPVDRRHALVLTGGMAPYKWFINGQDWESHTPLKVKQGERVVLDFVNKTPMAHPMHLHGHAFQVVGINGTAISGAVRDTIDIGPWQSASVAFDADNPGRWLVHCHILPHMDTGMITEVAYEG